MVDKAALTALASRFSIVPTTGTGPLRPVLTIVAPADARDPAASDDQLPLSITDVVRTVATVDVPRMKVDFSFLGKWVRSPEIGLPANPAQERPIGGMPIVEQLVLETGRLITTFIGTPPVPSLGGTLDPALTNALPPAALMMSSPGSATTPGVPEVLGQLACTVTDVVEQVTEVATVLPLRLSVEWTIVDDMGSGVAVSFLNTTGMSTAFPPGGLTLPADGVPSTNRQFLSLTLVLPALFSELTSGVPEVLRLTVRARIRLRATLPGPPATQIDSDMVDLPPVPLVIPTIPIPTILVFCENLNFTGRKLVVVPDNSLIGNSGPGGISIGTALSTLTVPAVTSLVPGHSLLPFLTSAAPGGATAAAAAFALTNLSPVPEDTIIVARSSIEDLSKIVFAPGGLFGGGFTAATMARSLIVIGRPGTIIDMYRAWNLSVDSGTQLEITLNGSLGCAIRDLAPNDPSAGPSATVVYPSPVPMPSIVTSFSPRWSHDRSIRSLALRPATTRFI